MNKVKVYVCGPTVYNYIHIGNARPLCVFDVLYRYLEYKGYEVTFIQNFTDIDDKIIKKANEEKIDFTMLSQKYIEEYKKDAKGLNLKKATHYPKATENISEIINIIKSLVEKGYAYKNNSGDVYFKPRSFKEYGKLSHQTVDDLQSGARINIDETKNDPLDFALWKSAKEGEPYWESPWGKGRPGWHIECSAMAKKYLGDTIDIHCGGQDLIFPHHENEIAQSECCSGAKFANYWLHNGYINVNSQKMSKSLGNFFTVRDVAEKYGYEPIRYLMIASHYKSPISYSEEIIMQCKSALERLYKFRENLNFALNNTNDKRESQNDFSMDLKIYEKKFFDAMDDDLNTADALATVFELVKDVNTDVISKNNFNKKVISEILKTFDCFTGILGIMYESKTDASSLTKEQIEELLEKRQMARQEKNWKLADEIRDELFAKNILIEDTPSGTKYSFK